jgi:hypothetical protein
MKMIATENQRQFLQSQISSWAGLPLDADLPSLHKALAFGIAEASAATDYRGNRDFQHNLLYWSGRVLEPVINQWLAGELRKQELKPSPIWPQGKKFAVCLTHDVDWVDLYSWRGQSRSVKTLLKGWRAGKWGCKPLVQGSLGFLAAALEGFQINHGGKLFEPWLEAEDQLGLRSTFFFFPDQASAYDRLDGPYYRHNDSFLFEGARITVAQFMRNLASAAWEVGLHATYKSFDDAGELQKQKLQIEVACGLEVVSVRQHCLHFDLARTPRAQSRAGFRYDSTFGFNRIIGFRNGLALPFYHYDLQTDQPLSILQIPLHIQDSALFRWDNLGLTPEEALRRSQELIDKVAEVNGLITLLWHPVLSDHGRFRGQLEVYRELLHYIKARDAWVATVQQVGQFWENIAPNHSDQRQ